MLRCLLLIQNFKFHKQKDKFSSRNKSFIFNSVDNDITVILGICTKYLPT